MAQLDTSKRETCPLCGSNYEGHKGIYISDDSYEIVVDGVRIKLTRRQTQALAGLVKVYPRVARKEFLMDYIYGNEPEADEPELKIIDVFMCKIRKILEPLGYGIDTIWGVGYRLKDKDISDGPKKHAA